jgi:hypothetical protein
MIWDLVSSNSQILKPRGFLTSMNKDVCTGIPRVQMYVGKILVGRIVLVQYRKNLAILVCNSNMVLAGSEIVNPELR